MVDAVFTWVDGNDPDHRAKRLRYQNEASSERTYKSAALETRFADSNELYYSLQLLRRNAPWIEKVYVVTDNQTPQWMTSEFVSRFGIQIVDHREIFAGFEHHLPTFNSRTIEALLWRIPGLSERFIYFNDDMFLIRPVGEEDFFRNGRMRCRGEWVNRSFLARKLRKLFGEIKRPGLVGKRPEVERLGLKRYFSLAHAPYPMTKTDLANAFAAEDELHQHLSYRFRGVDQIWPIGCATNKAFLAGMAERVDGDWAHLSPGGQDAETVNRFLDGLNRNERIRLLCVQSLDLANVEIRAMVELFFENRLGKHLTVNVR